MSMKSKIFPADTVYDTYDHLQIPYKNEFILFSHLFGKGKHFRFKIYKTRVLQTTLRFNQGFSKSLYVCILLSMFSKASTLVNTCSTAVPRVA